MSNANRGAFQSIASSLSSTIDGKHLSRLNKQRFVQLCNENESLGMWVLGEKRMVL